MADAAPTHFVDLRGSWAFSVDELWPEGDAPDPVTDADALDRVYRYIDKHGMIGFLRDWNLWRDLEVTVDGEVAS
jgi:hypothetical protein